MCYEIICGKEVEIENEVTDLKEWNLMSQGRSETYQSKANYLSDGEF